MALPTMAGTGRLIEDPALRYTDTGTAVCKVRLAFNARRKNQHTGEWEDGDTFFVTGTVFKDYAENVAESLSKGDLVMVTGRLRTNQWKDQEGNNRSTTEMTVDHIGPALAYSSATVKKMDRSAGAPQTTDSNESVQKEEPPF